jgi:hypothetical protein
MASADETFTETPLASRAPVGVRQAKVLDGLVVAIYSARSLTLLKPSHELGARSRHGTSLPGVGDRVPWYEKLHVDHAQLHLQAYLDGHCGCRGCCMVCSEPQEPPSEPPHGPDGFTPATHFVDDVNNTFDDIGTAFEEQVMASGTRGS